MCPQRTISSLSCSDPVNAQNTHADFHRLIAEAQKNDGRFRAVNRVLQLDSAASRMLQVADVVAHSRAWINRADENAAGLHDKYKIAVL